MLRVAHIIPPKRSVIPKLIMARGTLSWTGGQKSMGKGDSEWVKGKTEGRMWVVVVVGGGARVDL